MSLRRGGGGFLCVRCISWDLKVAKQKLVVGICGEVLYDNNIIVVIYVLGGVGLPRAWRQL